MQWGVGAISSQAFSSPIAGQLVMEQLADGVNGDDAISVALRLDDGKDSRQIHGELSMMRSRDSMS